MNLVQVAPTWLLLLFGSLLAAAAVEDAVRLRISNFICVGVLVTAIAAVAIAGLSVTLWQNVVLFAAILFLGTFAFGRGWIGGGDVKLFALCGLWFDFKGALIFFPAVLITGGVLTILLIALRRMASTRLKDRVIVLRPRSGVPYGVAIAIGTAAGVAIAA